jgi:poly-gamma-glutamate system protein
MEAVLYKAGKISHRSVAASLGGGGDYGRGLSDRGRQMLREAITRNGVERIEVSSLDSSINLRIAKYEQLCGGKPKLFISVGGGAAAIGHNENAMLIPTGFYPNLPARNYPNVGVLHLLAETGVPFIHLFDLHLIATDFELPKSPVPLPEPGNGGVFSTIPYDVRIAGLVLFVFIIIIGLVIRHDRKQYILKEEGADPDTLPIAK